MKRLWHLHPGETMWRSKTQFLFFLAWLSSHVLHVLPAILNGNELLLQKSTSMITWLILDMSGWDIHLSPRLNSTPSSTINKIDFQMSSCHFCAIPGTDDSVLCGNIFKPKWTKTNYKNKLLQQVRLHAQTHKHRHTVSHAWMPRHTATLLVHLPVCGNLHTLDF